jgi:hypothetical protein
VSEEIVSIPFDPVPVLESLHAYSRKLLFLDQNYWRGLIADGTPAWQTLRKRLQDLVSGGQLLVPVTTSNLVELSKLTDAGQLQDIATLMNDLSRSVVLVDSRVRLAREMAFFIRNHRAPPGFAARRRQHALSIWPALSGPVFLESHPSGRGREIAEAIAPEVFEAMARDGIRLTEPHMGGYPGWLREIDAKYESSMNDLRARNASLPRRSFEVQVRDEAAAQLAAGPTSFKALRREVGDELLARFTAAFPTDEGKRAAYMAGCPTLFTAAHVHAAYLEHPKRFLRSDAYDMENLITAAPYTDVAALDGHTRHIGSVRLQLDSTFGSRFASSPTEILDLMSGY